MEVRNQVAIYVAIALFVVFFILTFVPLGKRRGKYKKGKKVANAFYISEDPVFKRRMFIYKALTFVVVFFCCLSIALSTIMFARPYESKTTIEEKYTRDIFLCIDVSTSVDELNASIIENLKDIVQHMQGERFGLVIFNTSPVLLVPLTNDYEYILDELDRVEDHIKDRMSSYWYDEDDYLEQGTLIGNMERGSSLIGDGLAATLFDFNDINEDTERTRLIILATDNQLWGTPYLSLTEAAELCKSKDVYVYGIGTDTMTKKEKREMREAVELTGGKFYIQGQSGTCASIIKDIERDTKGFVEELEIVNETEIVEIPFMILLALITTMFVCTKIVRH